MKKSQSVTVLTLLIVFGIVLRFWNLNWGSLFYFHPDERNIASAVSQLQFPIQMNPNFFAYGSLPIYVFFFTGLLVNFFSPCHLSLATCSAPFEQAILISRLFSAVFSVALIPLLYAIGKRLWGEGSGLIAAALTTFSVGLIQFSHFGTYETFISFFSILLLFLILQYLEKPGRMLVISLGLITGILISLKISDLVLVPLPLLAVLAAHVKRHTLSGKAIATTLRESLLILCLTGLVFVVTNPFVLLDFSAFQGSMTYETSVAAGTLPVFYTQEFINTIPIVYHFRNIYPFLLNPVLVLVFLPALFTFSYFTLRKKLLEEGMILLFFLIVFIPQTVLFVKWTRYLIPTLPFIYLIITGGGYYLLKMLRQVKTWTLVTMILTGIVLLLSVFFATAYVLTAYVRQDTREQAAAFATQYLPKNGVYLSEVYDLGITPFNPHFSDITLFNFYDLETTSPEASPERLTDLLADTDYIIVPSPRLYKTRLLHQERFPAGYAFYAALRDEKGYKKIYETPCDLFCQVTYLGDPIFRFEDTANVFDRPTVMIYQRL
jgi:4-amino-4-deoxy-L-arabinose transferase-like glycosyltransferase